VTPRLDAALVVLAGGRSSRMGRPKHELVVGRVTLLEWLVARLAPSFAETIVVGAPAPRGARSVADRRDNAGPVAGIEAGLLAASWDRAFVLACDSPRVSARLASLLLERCADHDAAVPRILGRAQPTVAAYARRAAPKISAYLDTGRRRATEMLGALEVVYLDLPASGVAASELDDLDTPDDYETFLAEMRT